MESEFLVAMLVLAVIAIMFVYKKSGMRAMNPIPYDWDIKKQPIITTNNMDLSALLEQVSGGFIFPAI